MQKIFLASTPQKVIPMIHKFHPCFVTSIWFVSMTDFFFRILLYLKLLLTQQQSKKSKKHLISFRQSLHLFYFFLSYVYFFIFLNCVFCKQPYQFFQLTTTNNFTIYILLQLFPAESEECWPSLCCELCFVHGTVLLSTQGKRKSTLRLQNQAC